MSLAPKPVVGMIVPPAQGAVPPEPGALYPDIDFIATGLGLDRMTPDGYDSVIGKVEAAARDLAERGAQAVSLMGTSLSFYRGAAFNRTLKEAIAKATGLPASTMTDAILKALASFGAKRLAVATAYGETVNERLRAYLTGAGYEIAALDCLDIERVDDIFAVTDADLIALGTAAARAAPNAEALFISCGGLRTLDVTVPLEEATGLPVVSSAMAGAWDAARLVGHGGGAPGYGRLFDETRVKTRVLAP